MGKNKKMWNRKRKLNDRNDKQNKDRKPYAKVASTNPKMEAYYALQGLHDKRRDESQSDGDGDGAGAVKFVPCATPEEKEEERLKFMTTLRKPLSASFRIGQNMEEEFRDKLIRDVEGFVGAEIEIEVDEDGIAVDKNRSKDKDKDKDKEGDDEKENENKGDDEEKDAAGTAPVEAAPDAASESEPEPEPEKPTTIKKLAPAKHIPYIPNGYQLSVDRRTIRRNPKLQEFHEWLKVQTDAGFITRQETVSMIPPIVLSPESHHAVLDMCAGKSGHICFVLIL